MAWADSENADASDGASGFTSVTLSPKRLTAYITVSRQFLAQSPEDAEGILIADLARAIAEKIDMTVFGAGSGSTAQPAGLFADAASGSLATMAFDDVLALENKVEEKNGTDFVRTIVISKVNPISFAQAGYDQHLAVANQPGNPNVISQQNVFSGWRCEIDITYLENVIPLSTLLEVIRATGTFIGVGSRRGEEFGRYHIESVK